MAVEGEEGGFKSNMVRFTMPGWYQLTQITETLLTATVYTLWIWIDLV
jgi:hypothetical protein